MSRKDSSTLPRIGSRTGQRPGRGEFRVEMNCLSMSTEQSLAGRDGGSGGGQSMVNFGIVSDNFVKLAISIRH